MPSPFDLPHGFHKPIRLPKQNYIGLRAYFLTLCTHDRIPYFGSDRLARWVVAILRETAIQHSFCLRAYCLMPDHLHLLPQGASTSADLLSFVQSFKHKTTFPFRAKTGKELWQISFFDHILRTAEDLSETAEYILLNPVRSKLVSRPQDYPYSGTSPPPSQCSAQPKNPPKPSNRKM
jgi:putative transposase